MATPIQQCQNTEGNMLLNTTQHTVKNTRYSSNIITDETKNVVSSAYTDNQIPIRETVHIRLSDNEHLMSGMLWEEIKNRKKHEKLRSYTAAKATSGDHNH